MPIVPARSQAFTLIEVLVVMSILVLLSGLLMPMVSMIKRATQRSRTGAVLYKVDSALRQYHAEFGVYPYQQDYPDLDAGASLASQPNHLGRILGQEIDADNQQRVLADMDSAASAFCDESTTSPLRFLPSDTIDGNYAILLNRMARQQARLAVMAGDLTYHGPLFCSASSQTPIDRTAHVALSAPSSSASPGWTRDYFEGALEKRYIDPVSGAVLDDYGTPLVYISQNLPGITGSCDRIAGEQVKPFDSRSYGLGPQGFSSDAAIGLGASLIAQGRPLLVYSGRVRLSGTDAGDGLPVPALPPFLPDPTDLMHSDVRYFSAPGYETEFELWSAGPDRRFAWMRDDAANRDNISILPYTNDLH